MEDVEVPSGRSRGRGVRVHQAQVALHRAVAVVAAGTAAAAAGVHGGGRGGRGGDASLVVSPEHAHRSSVTKIDPAKSITVFVCKIRHETNAENTPNTMRCAVTRNVSRRDRKNHGQKNETK